MRNSFRRMVLIAVMGAVAICWNAVAEEQYDGAAFIDTRGYTGCVELTNGTVRAVLEPNCGGRVLVYARNGRDIMYNEPEHDGWTWAPGKAVISPCGGRFDVGPEYTFPGHPALWNGPWTAVITDDRSARLTSMRHDVTGLRLIREFTLAETGSHLRCTQIMVNEGPDTLRCCHWSRTYVKGGGSCVVPVTPGSRFPRDFILYGPGTVMNYQPEEHPRIRRGTGVIEILGNPPQPKFGFDTTAGWLAYASPGDLLFLKRFPVYPGRVYGEMAALTVSVFYFRDNRCEIEPIGPLEILPPDERASFTEDWWLEEWPWQGEDRVNVTAIRRRAEERELR